MDSSDTRQQGHGGTAELEETEEEDNKYMEIYSNKNDRMEDLKINIKTRKKQLHHEVQGRD